VPELLRMPEIAANTEQATLTHWPVPEHEPFAAADVIATIETAKAAVDIEAPSAGVILKTLVSPGTDVEVGDPLAVIGAPGETIENLHLVLAELGVAGFADSPDASTEPEASAEPEASIQAAAPTGADRSPEPGGSARVFASPLARKLVREHGIALETLHGSGPGGRIVRRDVETAIRAQRNRPGEAPPTPAPAEPAATGVDGAELVPHSRMRRAIAQRLSESKATIPHFYLRGSARVDALLALRGELNKAVSPARISVNDLVLKAVARAHTEVPAMNVVWSADGMRRLPSVDVGVAIAVDGGLLTPVLRGVEAMAVGRVAETVRDLAERARAGRLRPAELEGGAVAVTNLGMYGTEEFAAIINPPQSAILAVGAARREPIVGDDGELAVATVLRVTLSVDHRAIDGALAAQWMRVFLAILEQPLRIVA
jgi:pyruvate dehydrogenase E2 component (dihydrolipoamide acetyltransferase)